MKQRYMFMNTSASVTKSLLQGWRHVGQLRQTTTQTKLITLKTKGGSEYKNTEDYVAVLQNISAKYHKRQDLASAWELRDSFFLNESEKMLH